MVFNPFVIQMETGMPVEVTIDPAVASELRVTQKEPQWQTDWTSEYLADPAVEIFSIKSLDGELIGLAAYQIRGRSAYVFILYAESAPHSNPTMRPREE